MPNDTPDMLACGDFPNEIQGLYSRLLEHRMHKRPIAELICANPPKAYSERFDQIAYDDLSPKIKNCVDAVDALFQRLKDEALGGELIAETDLNDLISQALQHVAEMKKAYIGQDT